MYTAQVSLPRNSLVNFGEGTGPTETIARQLAALDACIQLHKRQQLDDYFNYIQPAKRGRRAAEYEDDYLEGVPLKAALKFVIKILKSPKFINFQEN